MRNLCKYADYFLNMFITFYNYFKLVSILCFCCLFLSNYGYGQNQGQIDSSISSLYKYSDDTVKVNILVKISLDYDGINPEKGLIFGNQAMELAQKLKWQKGIAISAYAIANNYLVKSDYPKSLEFFLKALKVNEVLNDNSKLTSNLGNIGLIYDQLGDYPKALEYEIKALNVAYKSNYKKGIADWLANIGHTYKSQKDYTKALEYDNKALEICKEINDKSKTAILLGNIGSIYHEQNDFLNALHYDYKALSLYIELGDRIGISIMNGNLGELYLKLYSDQTNSLPDSLKNKKPLLVKANTFLKKAIKIAKELNYFEALQEFYQKLSEVQTLSNDYKSALESSLLSNSIKDSIFSADNRQKIAVLEAKRNEELKQKEVEIHKLKLKEEKEEAERKERLQLLGIAALLLMLITIILLMIRKRVNHRYIEILGTFSILSVFEFVSFLLHPKFEDITNHNIILVFFCVVGLASILVPLHHKIEHWMKKKVGIIMIQHEESKKKVEALEDVKEKE